MVNSENTTENVNTQRKFDPEKIIRKLKAYYHIQSLVMRFRADVEKHLEPLVNQYPYDLGEYYFAVDLDVYLAELIKRIHEESIGIMDELEKETA